MQTEEIHSSPLETQMEQLKEQMEQLKLEDFGNLSQMEQFETQMEQLKKQIVQLKWQMDIPAVLFFDICSGRLATEKKAKAFEQLIECIYDPYSNLKALKQRIEDELKIKPEKLEDFQENWKQLVYAIFPSNGDEYEKYEELVVLYKVEDATTHVNSFEGAAQRFFEFCMGSATNADWRQLVRDITNITNIRLFRRLPGSIFYFKVEVLKAIIEKAIIKNEELYQKIYKDLPKNWQRLVNEFLSLVFVDESRNKDIERKLGVLYVVAIGEAAQRFFEFCIGSATDADWRQLARDIIDLSSLSKSSRSWTRSSLDGSEKLRDTVKVLRNIIEQVIIKEESNRKNCDALLKNWKRLVNEFSLFIPFYELSKLEELYIVEEGTTRVNSVEEAAKRFLYICTGPANEADFRQFVRDIIFLARGSSVSANEKSLTKTLSALREIIAKETEKENYNVQAIWSWLVHEIESIIRGQLKELYELEGGTHSHVPKESDIYERFFDLCKGSATEVDFNRLAICIAYFGCHLDYLKQIIEVVVNANPAMYDDLNKRWKLFVQKINLFGRILLDKFNGDSIPRELADLKRLEENDRGQDGQFQPSDAKEKIKAVTLALLRYYKQEDIRELERTGIEDGWARVLRFEIEDKELSKCERDVFLEDFGTIIEKVALSPDEKPTPDPLTASLTPKDMNKGESDNPQGTVSDMFAQPIVGAGKAEAAHSPR